MRRIGTVSSAMGLIFLGICMMVNISNAELAKQLIMYWPVIIVLLGIEFLMQFKRKTDDEKIKFNYILIPIVLVFLGVSVYTKVVNKVEGVFEFANKSIEAKDIHQEVNLDKIKDIVQSVDGDKLKGIVEDMDVDKFIDDIDVDNLNFNFENKKTRKVEISKNIIAYGNKIKFETDNADIKILRSQNKDIKIEGEVYIKERSKIDKYEIKEKKINAGYDIKINEDYVEKVKINIYIPDDYNVSINVINVYVKTEGSDIKSNIYVSGDNGIVSLQGDIEKSNIELTNGKVEIKNKLAKDINVNIDNGKVNINTEDKNLNIKAKVENGLCKVNDEKKVNSDITKTIGTGIGKIDVDINCGMVNIESQE